MPRTAISVDARLAAIGELCGKCKNFADIGTDHGRLGAYLLQTGLCERAQFTDVSGASLEKARRLVSMLGLAERASFHVGDGAAALMEKPDVAVIAGMGGETIAGILARGREMLRGVRLVIQPNVAAPELRRALMDLGYAITDERIVRDGGRLYVILAASEGQASYDETQLTVGPVLLATRSDELYEFARFRIRVAKKALGGIEAGGADPSAMQRELRIWEEVITWR